MNKRAQVASSTTWIVATVIIVTILIIFYYASYLFAVKTLEISFKKTFETDIGFLEKDNFLLTQSKIAYSLTSEDKKQSVISWADKNNIDVEGIE